MAGDARRDAKRGGAAMKTISWQRRTKVHDVVWELDLAQGQLEAWRNGFIVRTMYSDGREVLWDNQAWPMEIAKAWQEMKDVIAKEATQ